MVVIEFDNSTLRSPEQPLKAFDPMLTTDSGMIKDDI